MLKQIKVLGIALILGLGLNMVGCDDVEDTNTDGTQITQEQYEEALKNMTDEEKEEALVNVGYKGIKEFHGNIEKMTIQEAYDELDRWENCGIDYYGLDKHQGRLAIAKGMLKAVEIDSYGITTAEDIVGLYENMLEEGYTDTTEYLTRNDEIIEPQEAMTYEEFVQCVNIASIEIFGNNASQFQAKIIDFEYDKDDEIKVIFEYMATGRNVCYIMMNKYTGEYTVHDANVLQQILESLR